MYYNKALAYCQMILPKKIERAIDLLSLVGGVISPTEIAVPHAYYYTLVVLKIQQLDGYIITYCLI